MRIYTILQRICNKTSILILCVTAASFKINCTPSRVILANKVAHIQMLAYIQISNPLWVTLKATGMHTRVFYPEDGGCSFF